MIPVAMAAQPEGFELNVVLPGTAYLASIGFSEPDFTKHAYWRRVLLDIHEAYGGICSYSCHYIPYDTGADTVEHFVPKAVDRSRAYQWENYRLVASRYNGRKGVHQDVIDPFHVVDGLFQIAFPSLMLEPNPSATKGQTDEFYATVERLKLNDERALKARLEYVVQYAKGNVTFSYLQTHAPLIAREIERQGLKGSLSSLFA